MLWYTSFNTSAPMPLIQPHVLMTSGRSAHEVNMKWRPDRFVKYSCRRKWVPCM